MRLKEKRLYRHRGEARAEQPQGTDGESPRQKAEGGLEKREDFWHSQGTRGKVRPQAPQGLQRCEAQHLHIPPVRTFGGAAMGIWQQGCLIFPLSALPTILISEQLESDEGDHSETSTKSPKAPKEI